MNVDTTSQQATVVEAIKALTHELPLNDFGLPIGIYRADLLPFHDYAPLNTPRSQLAASDGEESPSTELAVPCETRKNGGSEPSAPPDDYRIAGFLAKSLNQAFVPLQYDEGFPAFNDGRAFWSRLECEPQDIFLAFDQYLKMPLGRPANYDEDGDLEDSGEEASGTRSLSTLVTRLHPNLANSQFLARIEQYREHFYLYYWGMRAHAYDLFRVAQHQKQQELRALETQDEHYVDARKIRGRLMQYMTNEEEFWELMTPKVAIDTLKQVTQLERISAGIPAAGPAPVREDGQGHQPFEIAFRTIAQTSRPQVGATMDDDGEVLAKALEDPESTEVLQEMIIKLGH